MVIYISGSGCALSNITSFLYTLPPQHINGLDLCSSLLKFKHKYIGSIQICLWFCLRLSAKGLTADILNMQLSFYFCRINGLVYLLEHILLYLTLTVRSVVLLYQLIIFSYLLAFIFWRISLLAIKPFHCFLLDFIDVLYII